MAAATASRLLVTGGSGLIGRAVIDAARGRYACLCCDIAGDEGQAEFLGLDLRDGSAVLAAVQSFRPTHIVHSGAISHPELAAGDPPRTIAVNTAGTAHLLEAARLAKVERFVFISSAAVYEGHAGAESLDETALPAPRSVYGASKAAAEALVQGYQGAFGLATVILRPCSVYGPRRRTFSVPGYLVASALDDAPAVVADGGHGIDFMHVDDAARAVLLSLESDAAAGKTYNVATGVRCTYAELAAIVRRICPSARISLAAGTSDLAAESGLEVARARNEIGFAAQLGIEAGLAALAESLAADPEARYMARTAGLARGAGLAGVAV